MLGEAQSNSQISAQILAKNVQIYIFSQYILINI